MPVLLQLTSSADLEGSRSRAIAEAFVAGWQARGSAYSVVTRDLHRDPLPPITHVLFHQPPAARPADAALPAALVAMQDELLAELMAADVLLVASPMYNYTIPASLKAWFEWVHIPGLTFGAGSQPLAGRPAVVAAARGGAYDAGTPTADHDHVLPLLDLLLGTMMGMQVTELVASYTLADSVEGFAPFRDRAATDLAGAVSAAAELAARIS